MNTALVTDPDRGPLRRLDGWHGDLNCVEGIAAAIGADIYQGSGQEGCEALTAYDVVIVNGNTTLLWLPAWLAARGVRSVLLWEGPVEEYYRRDAAALLQLRACLDAVSAVLVHGPDHVQTLAGIHRAVSWIGCPVPEPFPGRGGTPLGRWLNVPPAMHRGLPGALALAEAGLPFVQYVFPQERDAWERWLRGADVELRPTVSHGVFRGSLRTFRSVLCWDPLQTAGRFISDCCVAGVPCLASSHTAAAGWLDPSCRIDPPPAGRDALLERLRAPVPVPDPIPDLAPAAVRARWERVCHWLGELPCPSAPSNA